MLFLIIVLALILTALGIIIPVALVNNKYKCFVIANSDALANIIAINVKYHFKNIKNQDMHHSYDNENFFGDISCRDYLIYELIYKQRDVDISINNMIYNKELYSQYVDEVNRVCKLNSFGNAELLRNKEKLKSIEKKMFDEKILRPQTNFSIRVRLTLTNINGSYITQKSESFSPSEIKVIERQLNNKRGYFYLDDDIWHSICRVERGKVTNKMRFAIYARDHYRCVKCGRKTDDLEIDHIIPIAKGGKSTPDNLQTLCHRCNVRKGSNIE